jgi:hypothetical protein
VRRWRRSCARAPMGAAGGRPSLTGALHGPGGSVLAFCRRVRRLEPQGAQDHKAAYDGDPGPPTPRHGQLRAGAPHRHSGWAGLWSGCCAPGDARPCGDAHAA